MVERPTPKLPAGTAPRIWLGANFWSRIGGPLMWRSFEAEIVGQELRVLREHGLNVTRSFFYWPDFMPAADTINEECVGRYGRFLDLCGEVGISTIPTFIVGHMSGENWDVPWRNGRDLYSDGWMLAQQAFFIREMARRFKDHPSVAGWLISNEMPLYGSATEPEYARSWGQLMVRAVRAAGATQPVSLGDGAWGIEVTGTDNGFRLRDLAPVVDFVGPHVYPMGNDPLRQHLTAAFNCELSHLGKPVVLEEFGLTTDFASEEHAGDYYRQVLHTSLLAGAVGWISWNNTDFDLAHQDPYRHHPFELHFGITRTDGSPKAPLLELAKFGKLLEAMDFEHCRRPASDVAVIVPSYLETEYPFTPGEERPAIREILLQSYVATREADLGAAFVRELDGVSRAKLILVPSTKQLTGPTWEKLEARAREGATVYVSYFPGSTPVQRGPWHPFFNEFFGIEHQLRYGLVNPVEDNVVVWSFAKDFGDIRAGEELRFVAAGNEHGRVFLPLEPTEAGLRAADQHGRPALLERRVGSGSIVLSAYPVEYFAASRANANPEDTHRLYKALSVRAGVERPVTVERPDVLVDRLVHENGTEFVWFISEASRSLSITPRLSEGSRLVHVDTGEASPAPIELSPFGVEVRRLTRGNHGVTLH